MKKDKLFFKQAFTLIELIVVISVIAVLVLLAIPNFTDKVFRANKTKYIANAKQVEKAAERSYVDEGDWPRLTDIPYTNEEVKKYSEAIYDTTGNKIDLDPNGNYYNINYETLQSYLKVSPEEHDNYILQNPVGKVYYIENVNLDEKTKIDKEIATRGRITYVHEYKNNNEKINFHGIDNKAFDGVITTFVDNISHNERAVTWTGNLENREIKISGRGGQGNGLPYDRHLNVQFRDDKGKVVSPENLNTTGWTRIASSTSKVQSVDLVVPKNATSMVFKMSGGTTFRDYGKIHEIEVKDNKDRPKVEKVKTQATSSSITFDLTDFFRTIIRKDGRLLTDTTSNTFTDKPLYAGENQVYDITVYNQEGSGQHVRYEVGTSVDVVAFRGLGPAVFDGDETTFVDEIKDNEKVITWTGGLEYREIKVSGRAGWGNGLPYQRYLVAQFRDDDGNVLSPVNKNNTGWNTISTSRSSTKSVNLVVPKGATSLVLKTSGGTHFSESAKIYDIVTVSDGEVRPNFGDIETKQTNSSVTFDLSNYHRTIIRKNGNLLTDTTGETFTDKPLHANSEHTYDVIILDKDGNGQHIQHKVTIPVDVVAFRGLGASAFDGDTGTIVDGINHVERNITWQGNLAGRTVRISGTAGWGNGLPYQRYLVAQFRDEKGKVLSPSNKNTTSWITISTSRTSPKSVDLVVPEGATSIVLKTSGNTHFSEYGKVNDIVVIP